MIVRAMALFVLFVTTLTGVQAAEALHHEAVVRFFPDEGRIEAVDRLTLPDTTGATFRLSAGITSLEAFLDGRSVEAVQELGHWRLGEKPGPSQVLELHYAGELASTGDGEPPMLDREGGYLPAGSGWLPEFGQDLSSFDITFEMRDPFKAVATGRLVEEEAKGGLYRARFVSERPEELSAFVGPWVISERTSGQTRLRTYFYEGEEALAPLYLERSASYIEHFAHEIGHFPYQSFSVVAAPLPVGLGFPGLTYVSRQILPLPFMQTRSLAHEIVHSWWGNAVRVAYERGNWAEGLTTYMADYGLAEAEGEEAAHEMRLGWLRDYNALPETQDRPLTAFAGKSHDADQVVGYNKAAFVFHMLRRRVGDDAFKAALRRFYEDHRFERASWADLQSSFEAALGQDLAGFFAQWLDRPGAPHLDLGETDLRESAGGFKLDITLLQESPPYELLVPVEITTLGGTEQEVIAVQGKEVRSTFALASRPVQVAIDPDHHVFRRLAPGEAPPILRDVTLAEPALLIATHDEETEKLARELAARLLGRDVPTAPHGLLQERPLLVIGLTADVTEALADAGLPPPPSSIAGKGTARSWTARLPGGKALLAIAAETKEGLEALLRPLPHYRRESYLVFEGSKAVERGIWPAGDNPLRRRLD